ncbi:MAG: DUF58 domain-containing protein [Myxococcaceae bacterium]
MKRLLRRWWGNFRRLFPLRIGALILLALALIIVFLFSPNEGDFLLYPAGLVAGGLIAVCVLVVTLGTLSLRRHLKRLDAGLPESLETQRPNGTHFRFPALRRWLVLDVTLEWVEPPGAHVTLEELDGVLSEVVTLDERGRYENVTRRFTVKDVFGLAQLTFDLSWHVSLRIAPAAAKQGATLAAGRAQGDALANPTGRAEGDLVEMRQYAHGDPVKHVLWKVFARSRKLLVRMPERALAPGPVNVAFFVAGPDDEASAGAARLYLEAGLLGTDLVFSADGAAAPARTPGEAIEQIVDSAKEKQNGGSSLEGLASQIDPGRLHSCLIFAPATDGEWRQRVSGFVRNHGLDATVIIGVDQAGEPSRAKNRLEKFLFQPEKELDSQRPGLAKLKHALEAEGMPVRVLHRGTGQVL